MVFICFFKYFLLEKSIFKCFRFVTYGNDEEALQMKTLMDEGKVEYLGSKLSANYAFEKDPLVLFPLFSNTYFC